MKRVVDLLWLVLLGAFVFAIAPTFHGDEPMFVYMSRDFDALFIDHNPGALVTEPPYSIDSDPYLRLINGTVIRYTIGLSWHLAGLSVNDLPPRPGWDWGLDYDTNVSTGHMPSPEMLAAARLPSAIFLALSVIVMFALGWQFGGRALAYFVSALYVLNPVILLNGRRATQEASTLFFGLLVVLIAVLISKRRDQLRRDTGGSQTRPYRAGISLLLWAGLIVTGALTLASKQSGIVFTAGAFGWIFLAELTRLRLRELLWTTVRLIVAAVLVVGLFLGLSPAFWSNPPERVGDMLDARLQLIDIQVGADPNAPTTLMQRVEGIITEPFMTPVQHFEVPFWVNFKTVMDDVARYMASPFSGLQFGTVLGGALTLLAGIGMVFSLRRGWRAGLLAWLLVTAASLLANPLPWQRYYLPLLPVATLLAGIGLYELVRRFVWKPEQPAPLSHSAAQTP